MKGSSKIAAALAGIVLVLGLGVEGALALDYSFPSVVRVNNDPINQNYHYTWSSGMKNMAVHETTVHAVWTDYRQGYPEIYLGTSSDSGNTFSSNLKINDDQQSATHNYPTLALDNQGVPYIAWMDGRSGIWGISFAKVTGSQNPNIAVTVPTNPDDWAGFPTIAVSLAGDKVFLAWQEYTDGQNRIKFARSLTGGAAFESSLDLAGGFFPAMALGAAGEIYVAWMGWDAAQASWLIQVAKSSDNGQSFSAPAKVSPNVPADTVQFYPALAAHSDGSLMVAWTGWNNSPPTIYLAKSTDGAASFSQPVLVSDAPAHAFHDVPSLAVDPLGKVYVAWSDDRSGRNQVYMAKSLDGGQSFGKSSLVSQSLSQGYQNYLPSLAVDSGGNAHVLWAGTNLETYIPEVYFGYGYNPENLQNPPTTQVLSQPGAYVTTDQATFSYVGHSGNPRGLTYSYQLNQGNWSPWTTESSVSLSNLTQGTHTFKVRAKDALGQIDPTPPSVSFMVDYTNPLVTLGKKVILRYTRSIGSYNITFTGNAKDLISGLQEGSYRLITREGQILAQGSIKFNSLGGFSITTYVTNLPAAGLQVQLVVTVKDKAGNQSEYTSNSMFLRRY